jgi:hypothetical protein
MNVFKNKNYLNWKLLLPAIVIICLLISALPYLSPSHRAAVFSLGLPSTIAKYTSVTQHFSILYPSSWTFLETSGGNHGDKEAFAFINNPSPVFTNVLLARKVFPNGSLEEVAKWAEERAQTPYTTGYSVISEETHTANNHIGSLHTYTYDEKTLIGEYTIKCEDWFFISNSIGYDARFCAHQSDWDKVKDIYLLMINSFTVN